MSGGFLTVEFEENKQTCGGTNATETQTELRGERAPPAASARARTLAVAARPHREGRQCPRLPGTAGQPWPRVGPGRKAAEEAGSKAM